MANQHVEAGDKRYCWTCWRERHVKEKARKDAFGRPMGECEACMGKRGREALDAMPSLSSNGTVEPGERRRA